jgi:hypothetical protein
MVQSHRYFSWPQKGARNLCRQGIIYNKAISIFIYIVIIYNKWQFTNQEISIYSLRGNFTININQQRETWWTCKSTGKSWISWRKKKTNSHYDHKKTWAGRKFHWNLQPDMRPPEAKIGHQSSKSLVTWCCRDCCSSKRGSQLDSFQVFWWGLPDVKFGLCLAEVKFQCFRDGGSSNSRRIRSFTVIPGPTLICQCWLSPAQSHRWHKTTPRVQRRYMRISPVSLTALWIKTLLCWLKHQSI